MAHPKLLRALGIVSIASGALLLAGALPAFAIPGLTASGTGTIMTQLTDLTAPGTNSPEGVAVANGITYVTSPPTHSIQKFDAAGAYLGEISLPGGSPFPTAIVASADGSHLFATDDNSTGSVFSIVTATDAVTAFPVVTQPFAIALSHDGATFYVVSNGDALVYSYATSDGSAIGHSTSDGIYATAFHVMASPDGTKVYETMRDAIAPHTTGGLRILDASDLSEITHVDLPSASGLAESADGSKIWVGSTDSANQSVVAEYSADGTYSGRSAVVSPEPQTLIVSPDYKWIYAAGFQGATLDAIDVSTFTGAATGLNVGNGRGLALSADGLRLYSADSAGSTKVVSIAKLTLTSPATVNPSAGPTTFSAQITDGGSTLADYTTNSVVFEILNSANTVVATGSVAPDSSGAASTSLDLSTLPAGTYSVRATLDPIAGSVVVTASGLTIAAALAATGVDTVAPFGIAAGLLLLGAVLLVFRRRVTA